MIFLKEICVDISAKQEIGSTIYSKQGDGGLYYVKAKIVDGSKDEQITLKASDHNVCISAKKPDKTVVLDDDAEHIYINEDGTVTLMLTDQMQAVAGDERVEIVVTDKASGAQITTATFINCIISRAVQDGDIKSTDYVPLLERLIQQAATTYDDVKQYADAASVSAAAAAKSKTAAEAAKTAAETAKTTAEQKAAAASDSASAAANSAAAAAKSSTAANTSQTEAAKSKTAAEAAKTAAETAKTTAEQKAAAASDSASAAASSAAAAEKSNTEAAASAEQAKNSAAKVRFFINTGEDGLLHLYYEESEES